MYLLDPSTGASSGVSVNSPNEYEFFTSESAHHVRRNCLRRRSENPEYRDDSSSPAMPDTVNSGRSVDETVSRIIDKDETILDVVSSFGSELTSTEAAEREAAVEFLAKVVARIPPGTLSSLEIKSLLDFFSARLQDTVLVGTQVYAAIHHLTAKSGNFPEGSAFGIVEALLKEQNVQSCSHDSRHYIFSTLGYLIQHREEELRKAGSEFTLMFMRSIEGERDPRCLLQVFGVFATVASRMFLGPFANDLFEVIACYFPVDFSPPENDPYGITAVQLAGALEVCLVSNQSFAEPCLELIEETLTTEDVDDESKKAGLSLLKAALEVFPPKICMTYVSGLWQNLRRNILIPKGTDTESKALLALEALAKCLNQDEIEERTRREVVRQVLNDCEPFLMNVEMKLLSPTSALLRTIARVSPLYANQIVPRITPILMEKAQQGDSSSHTKAEYIPILDQWIQVACEMNALVSVAYLVDPVVSLALQTFRSSLQPTVLSAAFSMSSVLVGVETAEGERGKISADNLHALAEAIVDGFLVFGDQGVRRSSMTCLRSFAVRKNSELPMSKLLNMLKSKVELNPEAAVLYGCLFTDEQNHKTVLPHALDFLDHGPIHLALDMLETFIQFNDSSKNSKSTNDDAWLQILRRIRRRMSEDGTSWEEWTSVLPKCANTSLQLMLAFPQNEKEIIDWIITTLADSEKDLVVVYQKDICLFEDVLSAVKPQESEVTWERLVEAGLLRCINPSSGDGKSELAGKASLSAFRTFASLVPKFPKSSRSGSGKQALQSLNDSICDKKDNPETSPSTSSVKVRELGNLAGSLLICNWQPDAIEALTKLFQCIGSPNNAVKDAVQEIFDGFEKAEQQRIPRTLLFRQRVLSQIVPVFLKSFRSDSLEKSVHFGVLGLILANINWEAGAPNLEIAKLVPILIEALGEKGCWQSCGPVVAAVKHMLGSDISAKPLQIHLDTLINRLIDFSCSSTPIEKRLEALECISLLPRRYPVSVIQPHRKATKRKLLPLLDSHKRIIRRSAVLANNSW